jgi:hypothetical protein
VGCTWHRQVRTTATEHEDKMTAVPEVEYHDYANMLPGQREVVEGEKNGQNFPVRLHYMLNELEKEGNDDIASFAPQLLGAQAGSFRQRNPWQVSCGGKHERCVAFAGCR